MWAVKALLGIGLPASSDARIVSAVHRRAPEDFVAERVRKSVEDRHASGADRRLADAARADRRFRIGNVERGPLHLDRRIQNGGGLLWWKRLASGRP